MIDGVPRLSYKMFCSTTVSGTITSFSLSDGWILPGGLISPSLDHLCSYMIMTHADLKSLKPTGNPFLAATVQVQWRNTYCVIATCHHQLCRWSSAKARAKEAATTQLLITSLDWLPHSRDESEDCIQPVHCLRSAQTWSLLGAREIYLSDTPPCCTRNH